MPAISLAGRMIAALVMALGGATQGAVTITLTPSTVSNTYAGMVTLQVSGLNNGETVVVQNFADANANDVLDASDWLVQQYTLTDGQASVIGGITNFNVPGDATGADGAITASRSFVITGLGQTMIARYLYRLSSPTDRFAARTTSFVVTNTAFAQSFTGKVKCSGTNVPYAGVILFLPSSSGGIGREVAGVIADNSGSYTLKAPPGTYLLLPFKHGFVADVSTLPTLALNAGATKSQNLDLLPVTRTISGQAVDADNPSIGLPGIMAAWWSTNGLLAVGFTDSSGDFSSTVTSSLWRWSGESSGLVLRGYVDLNEDGSPIVLTTTGNVANVTVAFPKGTALFYGGVRDDQDHGLAGVRLYGYSSGGPLSSDATTDQNGNYVLAVNAGEWSVGIDDYDNNPNLAGYLFPWGNNVTFTNGQVVHQNFVGLPATYHITGTLKDGGNNPIGSVRIRAEAQINNHGYSVDANTDGSGYYDLNVVNGTWNVSIRSGEGNNSLSGDYLCPGGESVVIANNNAVVNFIALAGTHHITGHVQDANGVPICGVQAYAYAQLNGTFYQAQQDTDDNGNYSLTVANGSWTAHLNCHYGDNSLDNILGSGKYVDPSDQSVVIANNNGIADFTIQFPPPLQITTASLPGGTVGEYYSETLGVSGGQPPYSWWLPGGTSTLPPAASGTMNFSSNGTLSGTPGSSGTFSFWVSVSDNASPANVVTQLVSITIQHSIAPLQVTTFWLPSATVGVTYSNQCYASGGQPPYTWSLAPGSASLPSNVSLNTNGVISGTPTAYGDFPFWVRVTDAAAATADQLLSLTVNNPPLQVTTASLPDGMVGVAYSTQLGASGGLPPYYWSLAVGSASLPPGLSLANDGILFGTPTNKGPFNFIVQVRDANWASKNQLLGMSIHPRLTLNALGRPSSSEFEMRLDGVAGQNYTVQYSVTLDGWTTLLVTNAPGDSFTITDFGATNDFRFYRVLVGP